MKHEHDCDKAATLREWPEGDELSRARMWQMMLDQIPLTHRTIGRGLNRDQPSTRDRDHAFNRFNI